MENTVNYITFNPFHVTVFFLSPLKVSKNMWFSNVFWGVKKDASSMELVLKRLNFVFLTLLTPHLTIQNNIYMNKKFPIWQIYFSNQLLDSLPLLLGKNTNSPGSGLQRASASASSSSSETCRDNAGLTGADGGRGNRKC